MRKWIVFGLSYCYTVVFELMVVKSANSSLLEKQIIVVNLISI